MNGATANPLPVSAQICYLSSRLLLIFWSRAYVFGRGNAARARERYQPARAGKTDAVRRIQRIQGGGGALEVAVGIIENDRPGESIRGIVYKVDTAADERQSPGPAKQA